MPKKISMSWDIAKGLPPKAWFANSKGSPRDKGNYIVWPKDPSLDKTQISTDTIQCPIPGPQGTLAVQECYIAKIHKPYIRELPFSYKEWEEYPVDMNDKKNQRKIKRKLNRCLQSLGVAYIDRAGLMYASNSVKTCSWFVNYQGKEGIALNPWIVLKSNMGKLVRLVKKEVIHRALFRNLSELSNKTILNFTLDVLSMRVTATTPYDKLDKQMIRLCENLYPASIYKKYPIYILADCSLTARQVKKIVPADIARLWCELWEPNEKGLLPDLREIKPSALYFRIKSMVDESTLSNMQAGDINFPFNLMSDLESDDGQTFRDSSAASEFDKQNEALNKAVKKHSIPKRYRHKKNYNNSVTDFMDEQIYKKKDFITDDLKDIAKKLRTERVLEEMEGKLLKILGTEEQAIKPYPEYLSTTGMLMVGLGISDPDNFPLYWNNNKARDGNKKKVACFFDLSPSMSKFYPYMVRLVECLDTECNLALCTSNDAEPDGTARGAYAFAGNVRTMEKAELDLMKTGQFKPGRSTRFDEVIDHIVDQVNADNLDIILTFTDGEGGISDWEKVEQFNSSGKQCYNIYLTEHYGDGRDVTHVESDFDKLNGDSWTLNLPPVERF